MCSLASEGRHTGEEAESPCENSSDHTDSTIIHTRSSQLSRPSGPDSNAEPSAARGDAPAISGSSWLRCRGYPKRFSGLVRRIGFGSTRGTPRGPQRLGGNHGGRGASRLLLLPSSATLLERHSAPSQNPRHEIGCTHSSRASGGDRPRTSGPARHTPPLLLRCLRRSEGFTDNDDLSWRAARRPPSSRILTRARHPKNRFGSRRGSRDLFEAPL